MSPAHALLPDPAMLVARLRQLGMTDAPIEMVTLPTMYSHTFQREAAGGDEMLLNAVVSASVGNDGRGSLALVMTAYGEGESLQQDAMQAPLVAMLRSLYREAGLADAPKEAVEALHASMPTPPSDTLAPSERCWTSEGIHIEWDFCDEDDELPTLTLSLWRTLSDAEWQGWLHPGGVLAVQAAQVRDASENVLAHLASMLAEHRHPLAACASEMRVFLSMANDEGGTRTIVQLPGAAGASLWCDANPSGFSIQIVHADGRLEQLPKR